MMNRLQKAGLVICLVCPMSVVQADQLTDTGLYLSAGVGQNWIQSGLPEENTTVLKVAAGWQFNPYLALELGYKDLGEYPAPNSLYSDFDVTGATASIIAQFPLSERLAVYGKVGNFWWSADSSFFFFSRNGGENQLTILEFDESDIVYGLGVSYELSQQLEIDLEYNANDLEFSDWPGLNNKSSALTVSLKYEL
ncbi:outer membrane beta-barrel protein [Pseudohongiella sp. SYSU M77423]|uniref:outer membrane beta-barrel protein n=1 Tax=Pseudohongiella sp. SYSU M77423 TaxID=3042312 RepID=UPI0024818351|nr:outer membrane beta-barrel protein [Pseudohongiella sp. SYSU M77423]MDH7943728.1 outer membrane beta-barrel protein [Pseudohongiella sp. SYSU M77423]